MVPHSKRQTTNRMTRNSLCLHTPLKVIITDSDAGMTVAVEKLLPGTKHLHCLWHVMKNVRKNCTGLDTKKTHRFFRLIYAAAFAATEDVSNFYARLGAVFCPFLRRVQHFRSVPDYLFPARALPSGRVWQACSDAWEEIFALVKGSSCEGYVTGYLLK